MSKKEKRKMEKQKVQEGPIQPTENEVYAFNVLNGTCSAAQAELNRSVQARDAFIELMEIKYQAKFDPATGTFVKPAKKPEKEDKL